MERARLSGWWTLIRAFRTTSFLFNSSRIRKNGDPRFVIWLLKALRMAYRRSALPYARFMRRMTRYFTECITRKRKERRTNLRSRCRDIRGWMFAE